MTTVRTEPEATNESELNIPWQSVPDLCADLGLNGSRVRRLISDRGVLGLKRGRPAVFHIPATFFQQVDGQADAVEGLAGTITVLSDAGFSDAEIIDWLHTVDGGLGLSPIEALRAGHRKPVRRAAQLLT